jgi:glucan 1,3-beta-glucosidase
VSILIEVTAPGSQNSSDNSGHRITPPGWQQGDTISQNLAVLKTISSKYAQAQYQDVVVSVELLNEPLGSALSFVLERFFNAQR